MKAARSWIGAGLLLTLLVGCSKKEEAPPTAASNTPAQSTPATPPVPDVGRVDTVLTTATGIGSTPAAATTEAMKNAILQVNGTTIDTASVQVKFGLDISDGTDAVSIRGSQFAEAIAQRSGGTITNFKVVTMEEPKSKGDPYKVTIEANIAHFTAPADGKKVKVVIGPVKFDTPAFVIGGESAPSAKVADDIRQKVSVALEKSGRFSILDREMSPEIQSELDMVAAGQAPRAEVGKLGQAMTADLIWAGHIDNLAYLRHARKLQTSDRELVSFDGGWAVSQKLVNVATQQVFASDALSGKAPDIAPTTLGAGINSGGVLQNMETDIANAIVTSILGRTFPITVVQRDGNSVVLSQGGDSVKVGTRYAMVSMGAEMKDPQTGESLGRVEAPCCEVVIERVTPKLSYGHLENVKTKLEGLPPGGLQLREVLKSVLASETASNPAPQAASEVAQVTAPKKSSQKSQAAQGDAPQDVKKTDSRW